MGKVGLETAVGLGLLVGWAPVAVKAADGAELTAGDVPVTMVSNVQFNIEAGALTLVQVPELVFTGGTVAALVAGPTTLKLRGAAAEIQVDDFRGANTGWALSGRLSAFHHTGAEAQTLTPTTAIFSRAAASGTNAAGVELRAVDYARPATLVNAPAGRGSGTTTIPVTGGELILPRTVTIQAGVYRAEMAWTLAAQPDPAA